MGSPEQKVAKKRGRKPVPKPVVELKIWEKKTSNQIKKAIFMCDQRFCEKSYTTNFALKRHYQSSH